MRYPNPAAAQKPCRIHGLKTQELLQCRCENTELLSLAMSWGAAAVLQELRPELLLDRYNERIRDDRRRRAPPGPGGCPPPRQNLPLDHVSMTRGRAPKCSARDSTTQCTPPPSSQTGMSARYDTYYSLNVF